MEREIIEVYDSIIYELFIFMGAMLIYLVLGRQWVLTIFFGLPVIFIYIHTSKKIKRMKKALGLS